MDDIVQHIRSKNKHKQHEEPSDGCPYCTPEESLIEDDEDDLFDLLGDEPEEAPAPDKKVSRIARLFGRE